MDMNNDNNETCECGINEDTWVAYDLPCVNDGIHLWERKQQATPPFYVHPDSNAFISWD